MKFEFDHKTGTMQPKKDDQIYFAKSQGGGLIVDDKKNNIKYIIERDERITKLFGSFDRDSLNFYDMRDARMISDRVIRLFGRDHKYTDYHYFLKGYHMNENFVQKMSDVLDESVWSDLQDRSTGEVRKEDGEVIGRLEDNTVLVMPRDAFMDGDLVEFDELKYYTFNESGDDPAYVAVISDGSTDVYYKYDEDEEDPVNMVRCFEADSTVRTINDFGSLRALMNQDEWDNDYLDGLGVTVNENRVDFNLNMWCEFSIFDDHDKAIEYAIDCQKDLLEMETLTTESVKRFRNSLGDGFFNSDDLSADLRESYETYFDDLSEDEAIEELLRAEVIEDTADYFEVDEDGETNHSVPSFDYQDYKDKYVDARMNEIDDVVDEFIIHFGYDGIENYVDFDKLAELIIKADGPEDTIAFYDGVEREERIDYVTYYIYRTR